MSLLSYNELCELVEQGVITNVKPEQINASSIDLTLGDKILVERNDTAKALYVSLHNREPLLMKEYELTEEKYLIFLQPNEFCLAHTQQVFNLPPDISAEYKLKSSMARIGLEHLNAGWCDAGWNGSVLTLELKNMTRYHTIELQRGTAIGQIVFFKHSLVPPTKSYAARGRYNNDKTVTSAKKSPFANSQVLDEPEQLPLPFEKDAPNYTKVED